MIVLEPRFILSKNLTQFPRPSDNYPFLVWDKTTHNVSKYDVESTYTEDNIFFDLVCVTPNKELKEGQLLLTPNEEVVLLDWKTTILFKVLAKVARKLNNDTDDDFNFPIIIRCSHTNIICNINDKIQKLPELPELIKGIALLQIGSNYDFSDELKSLLSYEEYIKTIPSETLIGVIEFQDQYIAEMKTYLFEHYPDISDVLIPTVEEFIYNHTPRI